MERHACPHEAWRRNGDAIMTSYKQKPLHFLFLLLIAASANPLYSWEIDFFPDRRIPVSQHAALLKSTAIEVLYSQETMTKNHYAHFNFGSVVPMLQIAWQNKVVETGGFGGVYSRFELFSESFNFITADFLGGGYLALESGSLIYHASVYHISSHAGDDYLYYDNGHFVNTGYEAAEICVTWETTPWLSIGAGAEYRFARRPESTIFYAGSVMLEGRIDLMHWGIPLFFEGNLEMVDWYRYANIGLRLGLYTRYFFNTVVMGRQYQGNERHEFSITYYYGFSKAIYFQRTRESIVLIGPTYRY